MAAKTLKGWTESGIPQVLGGKVVWGDTGCKSSCDCVKLVRKSEGRSELTVKTASFDFRSEMLNDLDSEVSKLEAKLKDDPDKDAKVAAAHVDLVTRLIDFLAVSIGKAAVLS